MPVRMNACPHMPSLRTGLGYSHRMPEIIKADQNQTLNVIKAGVNARQSVMLVGDPGKGKSAVVRSLAREMGYDMITIVGSQRDATDITGFPRIESIADRNTGKQYQVQSYAVPSWQWRIMTERRIVLFLDEYSNSNPAVQASMLCLLNEREFANGDRMPDETVIIGAMNPVSSAANGFELSLPTCNRLMFVAWEPSDREWLDGLVDNWGHPEGIPKAELGWRKRIARFLTENPELIYKLPAKTQETKPVGIASSETAKLDIAAKAYPTNRSWTNLAKVIPFCKNADGAMSTRLIEQAAFGIVGNEATIRFIDFLERNYRGNGSGGSMPQPQQVIDNPQCVQWKQVNALQARQTLSAVMHIVDQDHSQASKVIGLFVHIADERGTDICGAYVNQLMRIASSERLQADIKSLMNAYKDMYAR